jgi:hypothetical protein
MEVKLGKPYTVHENGRSTVREIQSLEGKGTLEKANATMVQTNRNKK